MILLAGCEEMVDYPNIEGRYSGELTLVVADESFSAYVIRDVLQAGNNVTISGLLDDWYSATTWYIPVFAGTIDESGYFSADNNESSWANLLLEDEDLWGEYSSNSDWLQFRNGNSASAVISEVIETADCGDISITGVLTK